MGFFNNTYWWLQHRLNPRHRYHVIHTGLKPGWVDRDQLMAHLMIKCLVDFVEGEKPFEHFDTEDSLNKEDWVRLKDLYEFFKRTDHEEMKYEELDKKLVEIVGVRKLMWT